MDYVLVADHLGDLSLDQWDQYKTFFEAHSYMMIDEEKQSNLKWLIIIPNVSFGITIMINNSIIITLTLKYWDQIWILYQCS